MPRFLDINVGERVTRFKVPREYRDGIWADDFGRLQSLLRSRPGQEQDETLRLDFAACEWADPLPLLATAIEVQRLVSLGGRVILGLPRTKNRTTRVRQFVKFLASEGFLDQLTPKGVVDPEGMPYTQADKDALLDIHEELAYVNATCVRAVVTRLKPGNHEAAERLVEELLLRYETTARSYLPPWVRDDVLYRIEIVLKEVVSNVAEHGAADMDEPWAGIYVRYRHGPSQQVLEQRERWARTLRDEAAPQNCPLLPADYWLSRPACMEVFVIDAGSGMIASMNRAGLETRSHFPFRDACFAAFKDGKSSKANRPTAKGGLHLLSRLLGKTNDYIRGLDSGSWIGFGAPLQRHDASHDVLAQSAPASLPIPNPPSAIEVAEPAPPARGLAWTFRLSWTTATDRNKDWHRWQGALPAHPVLGALTRREDQRIPPLEYPSVRFDDRRWKTAIEVDRDQSSLAEAGDQFDSARYVLLPQPNLTKNEILRMFRQVADKRTNVRWTLLVADIPPREAATYRAALADRLFQDRFERWASWIEQIVLVTEQWSVMVLWPRSGAAGVLFEADSARSNAYVADVDSRPTGDADPASGLHALARCLRFHDSRTLWTTLRENWLRVFLNEKVKWSDGPGLNGYLDFAQSQSIPSVLALYDRALRRVQGLVDATLDRACQFQPFDRLTDVLTERANARNAAHAPTALVGVGSVIVSGVTARAGRTGAVSVLDVHFFVHPTCSEEPLPHLFLWPRAPWIEAQARRPSPSGGREYERVGRTAVVAPGGGKYFAVPRYDRDGNSVSHRAPPETYDDWQRARLPFTKVGHWRYGNHHDLLGLNLDLAIRDSFTMGTDLAGFLVTAFAAQLQIHPDDLSSLGSAWRDQVERTHDPEGRKRPGLVVYPSHTTTEAAMECFLTLIKPDVASKVQALLIPLRPIRRSSSGSAALVSPLAIERVTEQLHAGDVSDEVLLFDDAAISGRTQRELHQILKDAGATTIAPLVVVDRLRTPGAATGRDDREALRHYWRYDVPTAGTPVSCPMCRALQVAEQLLTAVVTVQARDRIATWLDEWRASSPVAEWNRGIESIPVVLDRPEKRFSLEWSERSQGFGAHGRVRLRRSIGLAIYSTELHTMTARDDVAITLCQGAGVPPSARMEVLITQLALFGSEYDVDTRLHMLDLALQSAATREKSDMYTSGVVLTALLEKPEIVAEALRPIWQERQAALTRGLGGVLRLNPDLELLTAHLLRHGIDLGIELPYVRRLLPSADASLAELLDAFHREGCPYLGAVHSSPLWKLGREVSWDMDLVAGAIDSVSKLEDLVRHLQRVRSGRSIPDWPRVRDTQLNVLASLGEARRNLEAITSAGPPDDSTRGALSLLLAMLESLYAAEFLRLDVKDVNAGCGEPPLEKAVAEVVVAISSHDWTAGVTEKVSRGQVTSQRWPAGARPAILVSPSGAGFSDAASELWVPWNGTIRNCLREIIMNVLHSESAIFDPGGRSCDAWIQVTYAGGGATIRIENAAPSLEGMPPKVPQPRSELDELGVDCVYVRTEHHFGVVMTLPYAGKVRSASVALPER